MIAIAMILGIFFQKCFSQWLYKILITIAIVASLLVSLYAKEEYDY
jgi:hypothetical protein